MVVSVTAFTAERSQAIEDGSVVSGTIVGDNLILIKFDESTVDAGNVRGPTGNTGPTGEVTTVAMNAAILLAAPTGEVRMFAGASAPTGWLFCDGSAISRATYAALFTVISTFHGDGNGTTTFNIPDLRGRAPIGVGTGSGLSARTMAQLVGSESHTLTGAESGTSVHTHTQTAHTHTQNSHNHTQDSHNHTQDSHQHFNATSSNFGNSGGTWPVPGSAGGLTGATVATNQAATATNQAATATNQNTTAVNNNTTAASAASAHNNMQPSYGINFMIKV